MTVRAVAIACSCWFVIGLGGCAAPAATLRPASGAEQTGLATWYGGKFHGRKTASGERFDQRALTAAHRTLPFGTVVRVTNQRNGRSVVVRINDRGPYGNRRRVIDLSRHAAEVIDMVQDGVVPVRIEVLRAPAPKERRR